MTGLLGVPYGITQASYDLARLRRKGLITRRPHTNTYDLGHAARRPRQRLRQRSNENGARGPLGSFFVRPAPTHRLARR
jgi:hypothetical protein